MFPVGPLKQTKQLFFKTCNILFCFDSLQMFGLLLGIFLLILKFVISANELSKAQRSKL